MNYAVFMTCRFAPSWLALTRAERKAFRSKHVLPIFERYAGRVSARFYDSESFHAEFSDFILFEAARIEDYYLLVEELRDCALLTEGHVELLESWASIENGFKYFAESVLAGAALARAGERRQ
jgi:hypothetical protein